MYVTCFGEETILLLTVPLDHEKNWTFLKQGKSGHKKLNFENCTAKSLADKEHEENSITKIVKF